MKLRKLNVQERRQHILKAYGEPDLLANGNTVKNYLRLADTMIENSIGIWGMPLGLATGFVIDNKPYTIPMATEEPSVIAAASFAAAVIGRRGGFVTSATDPVTSFQVFWKDPLGFHLKKMNSLRDDIEIFLNTHLESLQQRGGGLVRIDIQRVPEVDTTKLQVAVDVRDAQGANLLNTCAEEMGVFLKPHLGCLPLMAIVTNNSESRRAMATCILSATHLAQLCRGQLSPAKAIERVALAGKIAQHDRDRAVTHNKGIMNGITALALATGNDTRALEAAVHAWASRSGPYRGLSQFHVEEGNLVAQLELPLPLATVGGATQYHPSAQFSLNLLGQPESQTLARIAAALGLAQNLAALCALVSTGIQAGHMALHEKKQEQHEPRA